MNHPFLSLLEVICFRVLIRSKRIGFIAVKAHARQDTWLLRNSTDPDLPPKPAKSVMIMFDTAAAPSGDDPAHMMLERLYHAPDADKSV